MQGQGPGRTPVHCDERRAGCLTVLGPVERSVTGRDGGLDFAGLEEAERSLHDVAEFVRDDRVKRAIAPELVTISVSIVPGATSIVDGLIANSVSFTETRFGPPAFTVADPVIPA